MGVLKCGSECLKFFSPASYDDEVFAGLCKSVSEDFSQSGRSSCDECGTWVSIECHEAL